MSATYLMLTLLFSCFGMGYTMYAKRQRKVVPLLAGVGLMIFPYFVTSTAPMLLAGVALIVLPFLPPLRGI